MISVLIPYRRGDPSRDRVWRYCREWWAQHFPSWEVLSADAICLDWSRAEAVNNAYARARGHILVVCDADTIPARAQDMSLAVAKATLEEKLAIVGQNLHHLSEKATDRLIYDHMVEMERDCEWHWSAYNPFAIHRKHWVPFDERFVGWGAEDMAHTISLHADLGDALRIGADAYHLWHRQSPPHSHHNENEMLGHRYQAAYRDKEAVYRLRAEAADWKLRSI